MDIYVITSILQAMSISLGVGASTLAILNFFYAIKDGKIEPAERGLMGVNYTVLRVAMVLILLTTLSIFVIQGQISTYNYAQLTLVLVLFLNAGLMTARIMPSKFGPAIQASSWYSLGFILALVPHALTNFSFYNFGLYYLGFVAVVTIVINCVMSTLKKKSEQKPTETPTAP